MVAIQKDIDWSKWDSKENCFAKYSHVKSNLIYGKLPAEKLDLSIMIPTFRRADLLKEAIDSALNQKTKYSYTISVVDNDGEIDSGTDELMKKYCNEHSNILYYRNEQNIGMFGNWNRCVELSQTEWFGLLHDDDMLMESFVETLYTVAHNSDYGIVSGYKKVIDQRQTQNLHISATGRSSLVECLIKLFMLVRRGKPIPMRIEDISHFVMSPATTCLFNKKIAMDLGGFDDRFSPSSDIFFCAKVNKLIKNGVAFVPLWLHYYRIAQNESLKDITRWQCMGQTGELIKAVSRYLGLTERECNKNFAEAIMIVYNTFVDTNKVIGVEKVIKMFGLPQKYKNKWCQFSIMAKYNWRWGRLLFRKSLV